MKRYFQVSCHALIGSAFLALALTGRLDLLSLTFFSLAFTVSIYRTLRDLPALLSAQGAFYLSFFYIVFFLADAFVLSRSLINSTIHLVLFLEATKLHQEKTDRDYFYLIVLAFLKILAASSLTVDISFAATLALFLVALVSTLMSFDMYRAEREHAPKAVPAASSLGGISLWATAWIIAIGAVFFFVIPRAGTGYFTRAAINPLLLSGFEENVRLGQVGQVKLGTAVVMHAQRLAGTPFASLKWRGAALDTFDGTQWHKSDRSRRWIRGAGDAYPIQQTPVQGELVRYEILLEPIEPAVLPGPHQVRGIAGRLAPGIEIDDNDSIYATGVSRRIQYQVASEIGRGGAAISEEKRPAYLQLPEDLEPRVRQLALEITAGAATDLEKATRVEAYLKRNYQYTLTLSWNPGPQPLTTFLLSARAGHCEYFASSMAILLRAAEVPTRLVNGFLMGEYNPVSDAYVVRQSDAHSWVEAYIEGTGWMEFDPTPAAEESEGGLFAHAGNYIDAAALFWNSYLLTFDAENQSQLFRSAQEGVQHIQSGLQHRTEDLALWTRETADRLLETLGPHAAGGWLWFAGGAIAVLALAGHFRARIFSCWRLWKVRNGRAVSPQETRQVVELLFERAAHLAQGTPQRLSSQTWREWLSGVVHPQRRTILQRALEVFERSKYGSGQTSREDVAILEHAVRELRLLQ
jgi:transglutaminase-like putative cysteine protease